MTASFNISQLANKVNTDGELDASTGLYNEVPEANGGTGSNSLASVAVTSITAGTGIGLTGGPTGAVTITNTGGSGNATVTTSATNITLTNASNRGQVASFTADDKGFVLPDATTMTTLGYPIFALSNAGYYGSSIFASDGGKLGRVDVGGTNSTVALGLSNNSNASTGWFGAGAMNLKAYATTNLTIPVSSLQYEFTNPQRGNWDISPLGADSFIVAWTDSASETYAVVGTISGTTITFGTPVLVRASSTITQVTVVGLSSTNALVFMRDTGVGANGLTISGNTITTVSANASSITSVSMPSITKVDSTRAIIGYTTSTANATRIVTFNGASAPTYGTAVTLIGASYNTYSYTFSSFALIDTDKVVAFYSDSDSTAGTVFGDFARVCSISGTTITLGGQTTLSPSTTTGGSYNTQAIPISTTEAFCTNGYAVSVSGTTVTSLITAGQNDDFTDRNTQKYAYLGSNVLVNGTNVNVYKSYYDSPYLRSQGINFYNAVPYFTKTIALSSTTAVSVGGGYTGGSVDYATTLGACVIKPNI